MRVMQINRYFGSVGGIEEYIRTVDAGLRARGHECFTLFQEQVGALRPEDADRQLFRIEGATHPTRAQAAKVRAEVLSLAEREQPDLIYAHSVDHFALLRELACRWPVVQFVHSPNVFCPGGGKFWRLRPAVCTRPMGPGCLWHIFADGCGSRRPLNIAAAMRRSKEAIALCREAAGIVVDTEYMRDQLVLLGVPKERLAVLPTPVSFPDRVQSPPARPPEILFVGRLAPEKGITVLLEALPQVREDVRLVIVGDGQERGDLERLVERLRVTERVQFRGWLPPSQVSQRYVESTLVVVPSLWPEPFGMVGPEALGHARPVVGFGVGGTVDWLKDGETGLVARYADPQDLAEKINQLLEDREWAFQLGQQGRQHALARYTAENHLNHLLDLFDRVCRTTEM